MLTESFQPRRSPECRCHARNNYTQIVGAEAPQNVRKPAITFATGTATAQPFGNPCRPKLNEYTADYPTEWRSSFLVHAAKFVTFLPKIPHVWVESSIASKEMESVYGFNHDGTCPLDR